MTTARTARVRPARVRPPTRPRSRWRATPRSSPTCWPPWTGNASPPSAARTAATRSRSSAPSTSRPAPAAPYPWAHDGHAERLRRRDLARPAGAARHAGRRVDPAPGTAQRLVGERGRLHRRAAGRVPCPARRRRGPGLRDRVAGREDPGQRAARPRTRPDAPRGRRRARARHADRAGVLVLHPGRGTAGAVPGRGHRPDGRARRDSRRRGPGARPREREGDLRRHPGPLRRPDRVGGSPALQATFDAANFVQCGVRPFTDAYHQLRSSLVYLQVKDAVAVTGQVVPAGEGDGQVRETLAALRDSGFEGFMSLEPHLASAGRYGGFSGPEAFTRAARALKSLLQELGIPWQ